MIIKNLTFIIIVAMGLSILLTISCKKDEEPETPPPAPTTGVVEGYVVDGVDLDSLQGVRIVLYNANTNEPTNQIVTTNTNGKYSFTIAGGNYYIKLSRQGYLDIPARGMTALPFTVTNGASIFNDVEMFSNGLTNIGWVSGKLLSSDGDISSALIVAENGTAGYSTISDDSGYYYIFNVPAGSYTIKAWKAGLKSQTSNATVLTNDSIINADINVSNITGNIVSGSITFLATSNKEVDVALTHPITEETIPGLSTLTSSSTYSLPRVADETYLARASYANDDIVIDPDWIVKNGEPMVTVSGSSTTRNFSVTGSVSLVSPTNLASSTAPVITNANPTFEWSKYPSTSDYVIEVQDANGNVIWGGFNADWTVKNIVIPSSQTSIQFNSDGNATENLKIGYVYRWKIYASKDNTQSPTGWELISVSEDQRGLIVIE